MGNSNLEIKTIKEKEDSFTVEYEYEGKANASSFSKEEIWFKEDKDGVPTWVHRLLKIEEQNKIASQKKAERIANNKDLDSQKKTYTFTAEKIAEVKARLTRLNKNQLTMCTENQEESR